MRQRDLKKKEKEKKIRYNPEIILANKKGDKFKRHTIKMCQTHFVSGAT